MIQAIRDIPGLLRFCGETIEKDYWEKG